MKKEDVSAIKHLLSKPKQIAVIPHRNPDGDAMGSTIGLSLFLKKLGHHALVIAPNEFPPNLAWLPDAAQVVLFDKQTQKALDYIKYADLIFLLDFNALHRTGDMESPIEQAGAVKIMIDHHQMPEPCAKYIFSDTSFSSTCEMVYQFIEFLQLQEKLDDNIASCIYTGIVTDTGSFRFSATTARTHDIAAHLIRLGVPHANIHQALFDSNSLPSLQLLGTAINRLQIIGNGKISFTYLSRNDLVSHQYSKGDTEGIVNYGLSIKDVTFTVLFIEDTLEDIIKISFRSAGNFDVNQFARTYFDGGGHKNAAGGKSRDTLQDTIERFKNIILEIKNNS